MEVILNGYEALTRLLEEVQLIDPDMFKPDRPSLKDERITGPILPELRKMWCCLRSKSKLMQELRVEHEFSGESFEESSTYEQAVMVNYEHSALKEIFWLEVHRAYPALRKIDNVGVRRDWCIYKLSEEPNPFAAFFQRLQ